MLLPSLHLWTIFKPCLVAQQCVFTYAHILTVTHLPHAIQTPSLSEIGGQVEQLMRLMERMSARFVLLETRLKMAGDRGEGRRRRRNGASVAGTDSW